MGGACSQEPDRLQIDNVYSAADQAAVKTYQKDVPSQSYAKLMMGNPKLPPVLTETADVLKKSKPLAQPDERGNSLPAYEINGKKIVYHGEWLRGKPHGKGIAILPNKCYYEGGFKDGQANSTDSILVFPDGSHYRGEFRDSKIQGFGQFFYAHNGMRYRGNWVNDKPEGQGEQGYSDGNYYKGSFKNGLKEGKGEFKWVDGKIYSGYFKEGLMDGNGVLKKGKGSFQGIFSKGLKKQGKLITQYGKYEGKFKQGEMDGTGKFVWNDGKTYVGEFKNGCLNGKGSITYPNGQVAYGIWEKGQNIKLDKVQK